MRDDPRHQAKKKKKKPTMEQPVELEGYVSSQGVAPIGFELQAMEEGKFC